MRTTAVDLEYRRDGVSWRLPRPPAAALDTADREAEARSKAAT